MESVYLISDGEYYKVGRTKLSPLKRLKQLQTGNKNKLQLIHVYKCKDSRKLENRLHHILFFHKVRGEWYDLQSDLLDWLCSLDGEFFGC